VDANGNQSISVTIASAPKVTFALTNGVGGAPISGLGSKSQTATATVAQYPNFSFALAKIVPGVGTAPSRWVNYIVTTVPTKNATTGAITASVPTRPTTDNTGTLVDNGNGTYTYTFFRDITLAKAAVENATLTAPNVAADLDDLTFDPSMVHRLTIQLYGNAPGTGSNTPDGVTVTPAVVMTNPVNALFDFIPATGQKAASGREIVATSHCNECHKNLGGFPGIDPGADSAVFHGGNRNEVGYCVVCHTDQRKYGRTEAVVVAGGNYDGVSTNRINGLAVGNLAPHIHKLHMSANLTKIGYNYGGIAYETACKFPQDVRNCTKCHDGSATSTNKTAQGDNWMTVPQRAACGACHDGINFAGTAKTDTGSSLGFQGTGITLADAKRLKAIPPQALQQNGHAGGVQLDDAACALCHNPTRIDTNVKHIPVTPPSPANALLATNANPGSPNANTNAASIASNTSRLPAGAIKVTYEINSVSLNASRNPVMQFRLLQDGVPKDLNVLATTVANPATAQKEIWDNYMGAPSLYFVFSVPQDGIAAPADFNASASTYLRSLWNGTATGTSAGTLIVPAATGGFYTATLTGSTLPANAVMLTGGVGYSYNNKSSLPLTQTNVTGFPTAPATAAGLATGMPNTTGGLIVIAPNVQKAATGFTPRRPIVEDARCNTCHQELGAFTEDAFHAGQRNDGTTCSWCHNPNKSSSGWSADSTSFVHAIHSAAFRTVKYNWHAPTVDDGFYTVKYPGILNNCEACHLPGTFDYSAPASAIPFPNNRQYRAAAIGTTATTNFLPVTFSTSPYVDQAGATNYGTGFAFDANGAPTPGAAAGNPLNLVTSPIATVCFACHTDGLAMSHMESNGGTIYDARGTPATATAAATGALAKVEQCTLCHLTGKVADIKVVHQ
jgi:OmcA/MtrC family decaheme c-type cytochrome